MEKEIDFFIRDWNKNLEKVNGYQDYNSLIEFCFNSCKSVFEKFNLKKIVINISTNKIKYSEKILSFSSFEQSLHFCYHKFITNNDSKKRKFIYTGQSNRGYEIVFQRTVEIKKDNVNITKISQKEIDKKIVTDFLNKKNSTNNYFVNYSPNEKEHFFFYQLSLYNNSIYKIKQWFNLLKETSVKNKNFDPENLDLLSSAYKFFKIFNKLNSEKERLQFWFETLNKNKRFEYFIDYFDIEKTEAFGEYLIQSFKKKFFDKLQNDFKIKLKKTINKKEFIKSSIDDCNSLLNSSGSFRSFGEEGYKEVHQDLVKGNREKYYHKVEYLRLAGETEAIVSFIDFLKNQQNVSIAKQSIVKKIRNDIELLPIEIFENTKHYLKKNAIQVNSCYKYQAFDACLILLRKITETLIIELFEKEQIENRIRDNDDNYFMLKKLIVIFQNENQLKKYRSRVTNRTLPKLKEYGDLSAHMRRFNATKDDIDRMRDDFRSFFQELTYSIYH